MKKKDVMLVFCVIIAALVMLLIMKIIGGADGRQVKITVDGREYGVYSLDTDQEIEVNNEKNHNKICIRNGEAYMEEADCPDGYCMDQGHIKEGSQTIVCLPHKLVVEIIGTEESSEVDAENDTPDVVAK